MEKGNTEKEGKDQAEKGPADRGIIVPPVRDTKAFVIYATRWGTRKPSVLWQTRSGVWKAGQQCPKMHAIK